MATATNRRTATLLGLPLAAEKLGVSTKTVRRYIAEGKITGYRIGPRLIKVDATELEQLIKPIAAA